MSFSISTRYALRCLARHKRRTALSVVGIALGCCVSMLMVSFVRGEGEMMMRAAAESGTGHLRLVPREWTKTRDNRLRLPDWQEHLRMMRRIGEVEVVAPRARTEALLAFGTRTAGVEMVGVAPEREQRLNRLVRDVHRGRYLRPDDTDAVVIGSTLAERLDVRLDDDLMVTVSGRGGQMRGAMLRIVGIVSSGSRQIDMGLCHTPLQKVAGITGYENAAEITALVKEPDSIPSLVSRLRSRLPREVAVVTWAEILPELASGVEVDKTWTNLMVGLVIVMVFLGIASAQLTAVLERRREFAVLAALGMHGTQLVHIMVMEGVFLGLIGGGLGIVLGVPGAYLMAEYGIDFTAMYGEADLSVSNILLDPVIYGDFGWWLLPLALGLALGSTTLSSLYPAWYALRTDPATALRVEK